MVEGELALALFGTVCLLLLFDLCRFILAVPFCYTPRLALLSVTLMRA